MSTLLKKLVTSATLGLTLGLSGVALASPLETRHNATDFNEEIRLMASMPMMERGQAGRAGPESIPGYGMDKSQSPLETRHNATDFARDLDAARDAAGGHTGKTW